YYPTFLRYNPPELTNIGFVNFLWRTYAIGPWPSGSAWFLWVLLALDAVAALLWSVAHRAMAAFGQFIAGLRDRPVAAFAGFLAFSIVIYLPTRLIFGDTS